MIILCKVVMLLILCRAGCANISCMDRMENPQVGGLERMDPWQPVYERTTRSLAPRNPNSVMPKRSVTNTD